MSTGRLSRTTTAGPRVGATVVVALLALAGCAAPAADPEVAAAAPSVAPTEDAAGRGPSTDADRPAPAPSSPSSSEAPTSPDVVELDLSALEAAAGARLGVHAVDTGTGRAVSWRADERFAYASTVKALAAAVLLDRTGPGDLAEVVTWDADDLVTYSPVTEQHVGTGLPLAEVAEAAITVSDNTAGNLLLEAVGGPAALDAALAEVGDDVTEVVRVEPDLNEAARGDVRDTSTPQALAQTLRAYAVDDALPPEDRQQLLGWLRGTTTGDALVRSVVADGWVVADKTGTAGFGTRNDVAVVEPPGGGAPVVLAVLSDHDEADAEPDDGLVAAGACRALVALDVPVRDEDC